MKKAEKIPIITGVVTIVVVAVMVAGSYSSLAGLYAKLSDELSEVKGHVDEVSENVDEVSEKVGITPEKFICPKCGAEFSTAEARDKHLELAHPPKIATYGMWGTDVVVFWDPSETYSNEISTMNNVYEQLMRYDPITKSLEPLLATSWETSEDGLSWTFHLREGVKFHCGHTFTAKDVKFSIERAKERGMGASFIWSSVSSIDIIDDYTVQLKLAYPAPIDLIASAGYCAHMICSQCVKEKDELEDDGAHKWFCEGHDLGTGPYMVEKYNREEDWVLLKMFPDYWGGWPHGEKHFDKVLIRAYPEATTLRLDLEAAEIDFVDHLPLELIEDLRGVGGITVREQFSFQNLEALFNTEKAPCNNPLVRRALCYAMPYQKMIEDIRYEYATQTYGAIPEGITGHSKELFQYSYNLTKAQDLLEQAGYEDGLKLVLTYHAPDEEERKVAEIWKAELKKIGVDLEIKGLEWAAQVALAKGPMEDRQDIFLFYWWPDYPDAYSWFWVFHSTAPGEDIAFRFSYYNNTEYDSLIDEGTKILGVNKTRAEQLYIDAQEKLLEDAVACFIYDWTYVRPMRTWLRGYIDNPAYPHVVFWHECYKD